MTSAPTFFLALLVTASSTFFSPTTHADNILAKEYFVKAAFLYNFARLVEWPENKFKSDSDSFKLCFLGKDPFGPALRSIQNKKVAGRPLLIQRNVELANTSNCHILFISQSEIKQLDNILSYIKQFPVLTVSEIPQFAEQNGHIRLFLNNNEKISLKVNLISINQADLNISSRILTLAELVSTKEAFKP